MNALPLADRFVGSLLGMALGDALGGRFEGQSAEAIRSRFASVDALMRYPSDELWYTDDTQMAIGVAQALIDEGAIREETLCRKFVANYVPSRGYGRGARAVIEAMEDGRDYSATAEQFFPGGSYGNGAAMRVAPVGLFFHHDLPRVAAEAARSATPTHRHPWNRVRRDPGPGRCPGRARTARSRGVLRRALGGQPLARGPRQAGGSPQGGVSR